jgi:hypothetical protein
MAEAKATQRKSWLTIFAARPRLLAAALVGGVVGLALAKFDPALPTVTDVVI